MAKFSSKGLLGIAGILSFIVAALVYSYLTSVEPTAKADATVILAKTDILPNTVITADMVEQVNIPTSYRQPGAITNIKRVVGTVAKEHIMAQEQITERLMAVEGKTTGFSGIIPKGKRALSISVNDISGVAGLIKPGDWVDVIVTVDPGSTQAVANMPIQNILVLAANKNTDPGDNKESSTNNDAKVVTITLAVTPDEATLLALAEVKGSIFFSLRPYLPSDGSIAAVEVKTLSSLRGDWSNGETAVTAATPAPVQAPVQASAQTTVSATANSRSDVEASSNNMKTIAVVRGTQIQNIPIR